MKICLKRWSEVVETHVEEFFLKNPFPLYRGTPLGNELMKRYMLMHALEGAEANKKNAMIALADERPVVTAQLHPIPYLTNFWGFPIGGLGHIVTDNRANEVTHEAALALISTLTDSARRDGLNFLSVSLPGPSIAFVRALEKSGFLYAEGFINMVGPTNDFRDQFDVPNLRIREIIDTDFSWIADAYSKVYFPSRFVTDGGFDPTKAHELYIRRFREVKEKEIGKVFVAELDNEFAGAIIAIIDGKIEEAIGVKTNPLSGMGIIIHPRAARRGVSMALIEYRQEYYKSIGVEYVNFGANFNNRPMILGLGKLGLQYGSLDMTFHLWI